VYHRIDQESRVSSLNTVGWKGNPGTKTEVS